MTARNAALKALGLGAGAGRAEIDEAYRRLIKLHHPDRPGGDGGRAAEINRAYTLLRREGPPAVRPVRHVPVPVSARRRPRSALIPTLFIFLLLCCLIAGMTTMSRHDLDQRLSAVRWAALDAGQFGGAVSPLASFDDPLNDDVIDNAIDEALKFHGSNDLNDASAYSRDCQNNLRAEPSLAWFDACTAFDESMAALRGDDSGLEDGPFSDSELMTRELSAARVLSGDSLAADARLHQIRSQVEMRLLPTMDAAAGQTL